MSATTSTPATTTIPVSTDSKTTDAAATTASTDKKKKGGARGAPKKAKDASHDVKSGGGSSKKERKMRERTLTEKTISKPALQKLFCPKTKHAPKKEGDKATYTYLDPEHQGMRMSKQAIGPIQEFVVRELRKVVAVMVGGIAKDGRHNIGPADARGASRGALPRSHVFGIATA
jgi:hypothetical protein